MAVYLFIIVCVLVISTQILFMIYFIDAQQEIRKVPLRLRHNSCK